MRWALLCVAVALSAACGGPRRIEVQPIKNTKAPEMGPRASAEEVEGSVPPLMGLVKAKALVPDKLVPPEAPPDPPYEP